MSEANGIPVGSPDPEPEAWVVTGCSTPLDFWQQCQQQAQLPEPAMVVSHPGGSGDVLVIRGFDSLLHYLDWLDAVCVAGNRGQQPDGTAGVNNPVGVRV